MPYLEGFTDSWHFLRRFILVSLLIADELQKQEWKTENLRQINRNLARAKRLINRAYIIAYEIDQSRGTNDITTALTDFSKQVEKIEHSFV